MAEEELRERDAAALVSNEPDFSAGHTTNVTGGVKPGKRSLKKASIKVFGVIIAIIALILLFATPILSLDWISTRFIEQTDSQWADAVQNRAIVFQNALEEGSVPQATYQRLAQEGVEIGYLDGDTFVASRFGETKIAATDLDSSITYRNGNSKNSPLSLKLDDGTIIPANGFYNAVNTNVKLYNAFTNATYSRAAYYYDEEAQRVFREIGTSRNNYGGEEDFNTLMSELMGDGHNFGVDSQTWHYMPHWELANIKDPGSAYIASWYEVADTFNCQGANSNITIYNWNDYETTWNGVYDEDGNLVDYYYTIEDVPYSNGTYGCITDSANNFMRTLAQSNMNNTGDFTQSNLNTIDTLKVSDTITKEKRSMLLYAGIAESFSRTKAGYGSTSGDTNSILAAIATIGATTGGADVNDVMNWLFESTTTVSYDESGNPVYSTGSVLESPSVYAILTGENVNVDAIKNYSSDRIATIYENNTGIKEIGKYTTSRTLLETSSIGTSRVGRCAEQENTKCTTLEEAVPLENATPRYNIHEDTGAIENYNNGTYIDAITKVEPVINDSLYENSFDKLSGIKAGELLVEGAINVGYALAKASGMSNGTEAKVNDYLQLTSDVLAMEAASDRLNRSPLDITSKNTFLGSIIYKFAISSMKSGSIFNKVATVARVTGSAAKSLLPSVNADDNKEDLYLSTFGNCETKGYINATATGTCAPIGVSDMTTYADAYTLLNDEWMSENVECSGNTCKPKDGSSLMRYIEYNEMNNTPAGITDGGVIKKMESSEYNTTSATNNNGGIIGWFKNKWAALKGVLSNLVNNGGISLITINKVIKNSEYEIPPEANKGAFVVGGEMWDEYKLAQRYIGLARAAETMRQYDGDETAYNFYGFGLGNPIARYIEEHSDDRIASND